MKIRFALAAVALAAATSAGRAGADVRRLELPPPGTLPLTSAGVVTQSGEIVVMEGDDQIVSGSAGAYSISPENLDNIVSRFYMQYPDDFDGIAVFLSF